MAFEAFRKAGKVIRVRPTKFKTPQGSYGRRGMAMELKHIKNSLAGDVKQRKQGGAVPGSMKLLNQMRSAVKYQKQMAKNKMKGI